MLRVVYYMSQVAGNNWDDDELTPKEKGWLAIAASSPASLLKEIIKDKAN